MKELISNIESYLLADDKYHSKEMYWETICRTHWGIKQQVVLDESVPILIRIVALRALVVGTDSAKEVLKMLQSNNNS